MAYFNVYQSYKTQKPTFYPNFFYSEQASLRELLAPIKDKIRNFRQPKNFSKKRSLFKKLQESLIRTHTRQGKNCLTLCRIPSLLLTS